MKKILHGMIATMNSVNPPRMTALKQLHEAETGGPFSILIGNINNFIIFNHIIYLFL